MTGQTSQSGAQQANEREAYLVERARRGDVASFGELARSYEKTVYGVVSRMVSSRDEADDLVQDILLSAWRSIGRFRGEAQFGTWLHRIAVNATLKRIKWLKRRESVSLDDPDNHVEAYLSAPGDGPLEQVAGLEEREIVRKALTELSDKHRMTVVLYYFEQHSCDDIADMMGCSVGTVWSRLHYACKKLRRELEVLRPGTEMPQAAKEKVL